MQPPQIKHLGLTDYATVWHAMQRFTHEREASAADELWLTQHHPVYTQGLNGRKEHVLNPRGIPVLQVDRGGQVTYHGPGQLVLYTLLNIDRLKLGVRQLVSCLEQTVIEVLAEYAVTAEARRDAPGVYVGEAKIAALGLRVRKGNCYHGLSLNVAMDLDPFSGIDPCGYRGMPVTQLSALADNVEFTTVEQQLCNKLIGVLGYGQE